MLVLVLVISAGGIGGSLVDVSGGRPPLTSTMFLNRLGCIIDGATKGVDDDDDDDDDIGGAG